VGTGFHPELTDGKTSSERRHPGMGRAEIRRKFDEIVAFAEVEKFLDTPLSAFPAACTCACFCGGGHLERKS